MRHLLDAHTFLWWDSNSARLSVRAKQVCSNVNNLLLLSIASIWELQIKWQAGKLQLNRPLPDIVRDQLATNRVQLLSLTPEHVYALGQLPPVHKDPFDRILAAQAIIEGIPLLTRDPVFTRYPVTVIW
jgi:PIN domain nuclease of toxin-antitoxin system